MNANKRNSLIPAVLMALTVFLVTGCEATEKDKYYVEYRAENLAYDDGDDYIERYLLYAEDGEYERYIGGTYQGDVYAGPHWGTLYETGIYTEAADKDGKSLVITFYPKKRILDTETMKLENLGLPKQIPYSGTRTDTTLTLTWEVWSWDILGRVKIPIPYTRK